MGMSWARRLTLTVGALALCGALAWALWPQPVLVDMATVTRGPLVETIAAEGVTRVREPYAVTAPITGAVGRSPVHVGDTVVQDETIVARISPAAPSLMDARSRAQAEAAVTEAEAALELAETNLRRATSGLTHAQSEITRARALADAGTISARALEQFEQAFTEASQALAAARAERDLHRATLARARAQLLEPNGIGGTQDSVALRAPHSGTVLEVSDFSARLVTAGAPLLTIGDLQDLEIEVDLLSTDAVRVAPGARARVERWGGDGVLDAQVRRIEPAAFTRVSALGIDEQRVRLRLDFTSPPEDRVGLGDRYRVFVRIVTWESDAVLQVPQSALFRDEGGWAVFRVDDGGLARMVPVELGVQAEGQAQVTGGLNEGDRVVLYPASSLADGSAVAPRDDE
jgi:HlyD family secretion protein